MDQVVQTNLEAKSNIESWSKYIFLAQNKWIQYDPDLSTYTLYHFSV